MLAIAAPAQSARLRELVDVAVAEIVDPAKAEAATRRLEALGPQIVPLLRERLHYSRAEQTTVAQRAQLVYVLGCCGRAALPALPELRDILRGRDAVLGCQVLWTLGRVVTFLDQEKRDAVLADLAGALPAVRQDARAAVLTTLLSLSDDPDRGLRSCFRYHPHIVPACQWICARADEPIRGAAELVSLVTTELQRATTRPAVAFELGAAYEEADLAEAWLVLTKQPLEGMVARGLLSHWHPAQRRRGIAWMRDHGAELPLAERGDLVTRLWDAEPSLVAAACEALAHWGQQGLVALMPLRSLQRTHGDAGLRSRLAASANAIVDACATLPAGDREFVAGLDAILRREPVAGPAAVPTPAGLALAATMLRFGQWDEARTLADVIARFDGRNATEVAAEAIYGWVRTSDPEAANAVLAWLARNRDLARRAMESQSKEPMIGPECVRMARFMVRDASRPAAIEATAWVQTAGASSQELRDLLASQNTRLAVRAMCELLLREPGEMPAQLAEVWHEWLTAPADQPLLLLLINPGWPEPEAVTPHNSVAVRLAEPRRVLAALGLASHGLPIPESAELTAMVRAACGVGLSDLPRWLETQRKGGTLAATLDAIEADCRKRLGVPEQLGWPRAAAR